MTTILSIQSWVATGHVGNAAAIFPLQRLGAEVWAVHTVQFSNHPGHGGFRGRVFAAEAVGEVVQGIAERGVMAGCDAVLSGYLGDAAVGEAVLAAAAAVQAAHPGALYCCDPVIGDIGRGVFVRPGIAEFFASRAVPSADILTPNAFELGHLTGAAIGSEREAWAAVTALQRRMRDGGRRTVLVTSLQADGTPPDSLDLLAAGPDGRFRLRAPLLPIAPNGAGDVMAALFLFHLLRTGSTETALEAAASAVAGLLRATLAAGSDELALVAAQEEFVRPSLSLRAEPA